MKKTLNLVGAAIFIASLAAIASAFLPAEGGDTERFESFPIGETRFVQFSTGQASSLGSGHSSPQEEERRRLDQLRDWCFLTVLSHSGLSPRQISETIYDLPVVRDEAMRAAADFEFGETRSRPIGDGDVVALVPSGPEDRIRENLGHIADEQRKNLGVVPGNFWVFEYELSDDGASASITRLPSLSGRDLFTGDYGYFETEVRSLGDLKLFFNKVDDLTLVRRSEAGLVFGGRRILSRPYAGVGVEEIAALWRGHQGLPEDQGCGFSLDPRLDLPKFERKWEEVLLPFLRSQWMSPEIPPQVREILKTETSRDEETHLKELLLLGVLLAACEEARDAEFCNEFLQAAVWEASFQTARYIGQNLAGTEVGMTLFYTDLLMKLWSFDFAESAPRRIPGFPISTELQLSAVYRDELDETHGTRFWLGPLESGFQVSDRGRTLIFSRKATRLFARAHDPVRRQDQSEAEPDVYSRIFINWWNDHYEEIARYEPQYQRLNEIMKWSVAVAWLDFKDLSGRLGFLSESAPDAVSVTRTHELPVWAQRQPELTFQRWDEIEFERRGADTEAMQILKSNAFFHFGRQMSWEGGVSLASKGVMRQRAFVSTGIEKISPHARRAALNARLSNLEAGRLKALNAAEFRFSNFTRDAVSTVARAKPSARLGHAFGKFDNVAFERTLRRTSDGLLMRTRAHSTVFGDLRISEGRHGFSVSWRSRDLDLGQNLARRLSVEEPGKVFAATPELESVVVFDTGGYLVKMRGADQWIKLGRPTVAQSGGTLRARVASVGDNARSVEVAWLNRKAAYTELKEAGYVRVQVAARPDQNLRFDCCARAPPKGSTRTHISEGSRRIEAFRDANGQLYLKAPDALDARSLGAAKGTVLGPEELRLAGRFESAEYRVLARDLARDRVGFQARLKRVVTNELEQNTRLIRQGSSEEALKHVSRMIETYGPQPDFSYRKALLELGAGKTRNAAATLRESFRHGLSERELFFDEVNRRLAAAVNLQQRTNIYRVAQHAEWNSLPAASGEMRAAMRGGELTLEVKIPRMPDGRVLSSKEVTGALTETSFPVYIQDSPALSNLNPYTPVGRASLQQLVSNGRATVRRIDLSDVSHFQPQLLQDAGTTTLWLLSAGAPAQTPDAYLSAPTGDEEEESAPAGSFYLISPNSDQGS